MKLKKLAAILLVAVMLFGLATAAMAASVTITNIPSATDKTAFEFYKIVTKDVAGLYSFTDAKIKAAVVTAIGDAAITTATADDQILLYITTETLPANFALNLAAALETLIDADAVLKAAVTVSPTIDTTTPYKVTFAADGYYLIVDGTTTYGDKLQSIAPMLVFADGNETIALKTRVHTVTGKEVTGIVTPAITDHLGNSVSVGDVVGFKITVEVPEYAQYADRVFKVYDLMGVGYTYAGSVVVKDGSGTLTAGTDYTATELTGAARTAFFTASSITDAGQTVIEFNFLPNIEALTVGDTITITYNATVNSDVGGAAVNETVALQNGIYVTGGGTETPTYGFEVDKSDEYGNDLAGVKFFLTDGGDPAQLLKFKVVRGVYVFDGVWDWANEDPDDYPTDFVPPSYNAVTNVWTINSDGPFSLVTGANGNFKVHGLQEGVFVLTEYETLPGYNLLTAPVSIYLGEIDDDDDDNLNQYTYPILNSTAIELPGTGGIGTMLFTFFGCAIILGGFVLLAVNRKRVFGK